MKRSMIALFLALTSTIGIFLLMSSLIKTEGKIVKSSSENTFMDFVRLKSSENTEEKQRKLPDKPPPLQSLKSMDAKSITKPNLKSSLPSTTNTLPFDLPTKLTQADLGMGGIRGGGNGDQDVVPEVRTMLEFPLKAKRLGIEGWVVMEFDINPQGRVTNVVVLDSQPKRIFDKAAQSTVLKWKYKPKTVDGKNVEQKGIQIKLDFKLVDEEA